MLDESLNSKKVDRATLKRAWSFARSNPGRVLSLDRSGAATQMASAVRPGAGPLSMLSQAADSTDRIAALIMAATAQGSSESN